MDGKNLITEILVRYSQGEALSEAEEASLDDWCAQSEDHRSELEKFRNPEWVEEQQRLLHSAPSEEMWVRIDKYIGENGAVDKPSVFLLLRYIGWWKSLVVAAVLVFFVVAAWRLWAGMVRDKATVGLAFRPPEPVKPAAPLPEAFDAAFERADGETLLLDKMAGGEAVVLENGWWLRKLDSQNYSYESGVAGDPTSLPGGKFRTGKNGLATLHLPDQSQITLNENSDLRCNADGRKFELGGEAHFSIAGDPSKPCIVQLGPDKSVEVLGTSFDARAYKGETDNWVTVLSGAVRVRNGDRSALLKKKQQARMGGQGVELSTLADPSVILAWAERGVRRGSVGVADADLKTVLRTVASLYGVQIANPSNIRGYAITGTLTSTETLENTLKSIEKLQWRTVRLERRGDTVVVTPLPSNKKSNY